jgi:hypothetical protein
MHRIGCRFKESSMSDLRLIAGPRILLVALSLLGAGAPAWAQARSTPS